MSAAFVFAVLLAALAGWLLPSGVAAGVDQAARPRPGEGRCPRAGPVVRALTRSRDAERLRAQLDELLDALAAELRTGASPQAALVAAAEGLSLLEPVRLVASAPSGDVVGALAEVASRPGGEAAGDLALVWQVAASTGCGLSTPVARLLASRRAQQQVRVELRAQLAGPRATARMLAGLPLAGVAMGSALGVEPLGFLTGTGLGRVCLVAGVALLGLGWWWSRAIVAGARSPSSSSG